MSRLLLGALVLCLLGLPAAADDNKKDAEALKGTWKVTKVSVDGQTPPDADNAFLHLTTDELAPELGGRKQPPAKYKLDASKSPKQIDLEPPGQGMMIEGIYEIKGDTLKLCFRRMGGRPTSFDTTGEGVIKVEAKREKK
jgi:uncharacterized protein (TIGR03067 family)